MSSSSASLAAQWEQHSLAALMRHIVATHHLFSRNESARLAGLFADELATRRQDDHLLRLQRIFTQLTSTLIVHLAKEEQVLFPMIAQLEEAAARQLPRPRFTFGSIASPIRMMNLEHQEADALVRRMRELTANFAPPPEAGERAQALYAGLAAFDRDLEQHACLEDEVLFPRAIALETSLAPKP